MPYLHSKLTVQEDSKILLPAACQRDPVPFSRGHRVLLEAIIRDVFNGCL